MTWGDLRKVVRYLHAVAGPASSGGPTDGQLLERYVGQGDEAAFELLLWRHGAMVLNVCRRILYDEHDAEDAFQATFLAFVRKARSIVRRDAVAGWLYRVAYRVAVEARNKAQKRAQREKQGAANLASEAAPEAGWHELRPLLDEEMLRLPERLRLPLVLCYLEGKTNEEAARQLGCPPGTIFSRLARGRELLRHRLTRRGLVISTGILTTLLSQNAASAAVSSLLIHPTFKAALLFAAAHTTTGTASARVIALAEGVLKAMYLTKLKVVAALVLVMGVLLAGGILTRHALVAAPQQEANQDKVTKPDDAPKPGQEVKKGPVVVQVMTPLPGGLERMAMQPGTVQPMSQAEIFAPVAGVLKNLTVDLGSRVKRGEVLAEIDAPLLVLEEKQAVVDVKQARGLVQEAEARVATARAEVEVVKVVVHEKAVAAAVTGGEIALASAKADMKVKESKVAQADAALETARAGLETSELGLEKARYSLGLTRIVAPFDGVVTQRNYMAGDTTRTGDQGRQLPLLTVVRIDSVRVVVDVPESDVPLTEPGQPVDLNIDSLPDERLPGYKVSRIGVVVDEKTRTMRVEIDVPNPKGLLRPGMQGGVMIHLQKRSADALRIPQSSVIMSDNRPWVYVVRDGKAHRTLISVRDRSGDGKEAEIDSGLKPTDRVVIDPKGLTGDVVPVEIKKEPDRK